MKNSDPRIIKIRPAEEYFSLNWQLGIRCNYDCMYCAPEWHNSDGKNIDLDTMKKAWLEVFDKTKHLGLKYKISFAGGELTINKDFLPFVEWLRSKFREHIFKIQVTTNGSASLKYYQKMFLYIDNISFSVHSEHFDETKFFKNMVALHQSIGPDRFLQVVIMDEFWNQDRIPHYIKILEKHGISYNVNKIDYEYQTRSFPIFKGKLNLEI
jgi:molybdenum cofactor biosynthesis enzyme MoaA